MIDLKLLNFFGKCHQIWLWWSPQTSQIFYRWQHRWIEPFSGREVVGICNLVVVWNSISYNNRNIFLKKEKYTGQTQWEDLYIVLLPRFTFSFDQLVLFYLCRCWFGCFTKVGYLMWLVVITLAKINQNVSETLKIVTPTEFISFVSSDAGIPGGPNEGLSVARWSSFKDEIIHVWSISFAIKFWYSVIDQVEIVLVWFSAGEYVLWFYVSVNHIPE